MKKARLRETGTGIETQTPISPVEGVWMLPGFGNTGVVETDDGHVLIDVPGVRWIDRMMEMLRDNLSAPIHTIFLTHGHLDHALTLAPIFEEAKRKGNPAPRVIAHRNLLNRFNRYRMLVRDHARRELSRSPYSDG